jgi:dihydrodipicolinate reductase
MRVLLAIMFLAGGVLLTGAQAGEKKDDKKEVTLKGKICCAKCELGVETECMTVIVTKKDKKDVTIYFDKASDKKHHASICAEAKNGSVTGTVMEKDKKKSIAVKTLKFD